MVTNTPPQSGQLRASVLVPLSADTFERARNWAWLAARWAAYHPDLEVVLAEDPGPGPFSKGRALALAAEAARTGVFVLADADCWVSVAALEGALDALGSAPWVVPHRNVYRLAPARTVALTGGPVVDALGPLARRDLCRHHYQGVAGGGVAVLTRAAWDTVGGVDPRFCGWGGEDDSLGWALDALCGPHVRLDAPLWHLHHPAAPTRRRALPESNALAGRYLDALKDPAAMAALISERGN